MAVQFVDIDPDAILAELVSQYEELAGRKLHPAQAERLVIQAFAYRETLLRNIINEAANQNLVSFARGMALEHLGDLVGVNRLPAAAAECTIRFILVAGHGNLLIPGNIRIQSLDGQAIFLTTESKNVNDSVLTIDIKARCTKDGILGNGYQTGQIAIILDPQPYLVSASNVAETAGGSNMETDEELRERIRLAPNEFSVAGPADAYVSFARKAHPLIVDVAATLGSNSFGAPIPGQVDIFPLLENNQPLTAEISDAVYAQCNPKKRRPLCDTVVVKEPSRIEYNIFIDIILLTDAVQSSIVQQVNERLNAYVDARKNKLGIDVVISQIIAAAQVAGVYKVLVNSPTEDIVCNKQSFTNCTGININVTGTSDE